jgi:hypothetical protein
MPDHIFCINLTFWELMGKWAVRQPASISGGFRREWSRGGVDFGDISLENLHF